MNFIEALKSGKPFRHHSWAKGVFAKADVMFISLYNVDSLGKEPYCEKYIVMVNELKDETGWEILKEKKKIETTYFDIHTWPCKCPMNAKVTIEWEE